MTLRLGLMQMKLFSLTCTTCVLIYSIIMMIRTVFFSRSWSVIAPAIAHLFQVGSDVAFYMAIVTFLIGVFGIIAISINCYGMLIVYFILLVLITLAMTTYGCLYYEEVRHDNGDAVRSLAVQLSAMTREQLISIQREFHCCGIDKYTDYLVPYHIMSAAQPTWPFTDHSPVITYGTDIVVTEINSESGLPFLGIFPEILGSAVSSLWDYLPKPIDFIPNPKDYVPNPEQYLPENPAKAFEFVPNTQMLFDPWLYIATTTRKPYDERFPNEEELGLVPEDSDTYQGLEGNEHQDVIDANQKNKIKAAVKEKLEKLNLPSYLENIAEYPPYNNSLDAPLYGPLDGAQYNSLDIPSVDVAETGVIQNASNSDSDKGYSDQYYMASNLDVKKKEFVEDERKILSTSSEKNLPFVDAVLKNIQRTNSTEKIFVPVDKVLKNAKEINGTRAVLEPVDDLSNVIEEINGTEEILDGPYFVPLLPNYDYINLGFPFVNNKSFLKPVPTIFDKEVHGVKKKALPLQKKYRREGSDWIPTDDTCYHMVLPKEIACFTSEPNITCTTKAGCWKSEKDWTRGCLEYSEEDLGKIINIPDMKCCYSISCNRFRNEQDMSPPTGATISLPESGTTEFPSPVSGGTNPANRPTGDKGSYLEEFLSIADSEFNERVYFLTDVHHFIKFWLEENDNYKEIFQWLSGEENQKNKNLRGFLSRITTTFFEMGSMLLDDPQKKMLQELKDMDWWWGSGWDHHFYRFLSADKFDDLPKSCCRNPTKRCRGLPYDTWLHGCRDALVLYWHRINLEIAIMFFGYVIILIATTCVVFVFIGGIKDKYYP